MAASLAWNRQRRPMVVYWIVAACFLSLGLTSCATNERETPPPPATAAPTVLLNVGISENAAALAALWAEGYATEAEDAFVNFVAGNSATLFEDLEAGGLDAVLGHHIPEATQDGDGLWFNPVALDGLVVVVHPENPVRSLTQGQVQGLFSGDLSSWSSVGGNERDVQPFGQERGDGAREIFTRRLMGARPTSINTIVQSDSVSLLEAVAAEPAAIGYTMLSALASSVRAVNIDGVAPTPATVASQDYPLTTPLYFVSRREPQGALRAFLAWLQSEDGQAIVSEKVGTVR